MKHLKIAVIRTKGMPFVCIMLCGLCLSIRLALPGYQGLGIILVLLLILCFVIAIFDLIYAYMRDIVKD